MEINAETWDIKNTRLKKVVPYIVLLALIAMIITVITLKNKHRASAITVTETDSVFIPDTASEKKIDSLKRFTAIAVQELHKYEQLKKDYEQQEAQILYKPVVDSSQIIALRARLTAANKEINRLKNNLAEAERTKIYVDRYADTYAYEQTDIETPDENSIIITFDGRSRNGNIFTDRLVVYLIPYTKKIRQHMRYETSCDEKLYGNAQAKYYNGLYYFNDVQPGKYLIKVCTYYGNFRVIDKQAGKLNVSMQVSPPIQ